MVCDVMDEDRTAPMVRSAVNTFGSLDMAFNNPDVQSPLSDAADWRARTSTASTPDRPGSSPNCSGRSEDPSRCGGTAFVFVRLSDVDNRGTGVRPARCLRRGQTDAETRPSP
ncbi:hypothetical protein [Streptomyces sp. SID13726]|uniref:hypothetical protein n=1 Tax=Streptomyces sp. SID13726 TaxID=2706058 RepID=UPI0013B729D0|nr:hypothetical protein [Streptomyces sp. SID13726]NEA99025.1 hypothetical protein [Streptomyces sp. SID13726]